MNFDEIETFLSVVQHENIARAASELFIGQGTASSRIQHLEQELGISLFFRQKGIKNVTLTPEGENFLPIAQQMTALLRQAGQIRNRMVFQELRIGAVDTLNQFHFIKVYRDFMEKNPTVRLFLQTEHSTELHQLIENQQIDLGFVFSLHKFPNVTALPLYREESVILYHRNSRFGQTGDPGDLRGEDEIYQTYGNAYDLWHRQHFPDSDMRKLSVGTFSMLPHFIDLAGSWAILPRSLAERMAGEREDLAWTPFSSDPPPARTAYLLRYKYAKPWVQQLGGLFLREVTEMVRANPAMELLYPEGREG